MLTDSDKSSKCSNGNSQEITSAIDHTSNTAVSELLLKLIGNLEAAVASSKANFQLKLLLLQLFNLIGQFLDNLMFVCIQTTCINMTNNSLAEPSGAID